MREQLTNLFARQLASWLAVAFCCAEGCTSHSFDHPETAIVSGRVTYRGAPVGNAKVVFIRAGAPRFASGQTDVAGRFELSTYTPGDGAVIGKNAVIVVKRLAADNHSAEPIDPSTANNADLDAAFDREAKGAPARSAIPMKYANQKTSGIECDVVRGENNVEIQLTD